MSKVMKFFFVLIVSTWASFSLALPTYYYDLDIKDIEINPNPPTTSHGYTLHLKENLTGTGCDSGSVSIESGSFHGTALSVLLAAMMGDKKIFLRISHCTDRPVADYVGIVK